MILIGVIVVGILTTGIVIVNKFILSGSASPTNVPVTVKTENKTYSDVVNLAQNNTATASSTPTPDLTATMTLQASPTDTPVPSPTEIVLSDVTPPLSSPTADVAAVTSPSPTATTLTQLPTTGNFNATFLIVATSFTFIFFAFVL